MSVVNVFSPAFDPCDSYGRVASELADALTAYGHRVNRISPNAPAQTVKPAFGGFLLGYPTRHAGYGVMAMRGVRVALTMFEASQLPVGWVETLNACDAVIVPGNWCKQMFERNGVTVPIHVVPLGISREFLKPRIRQVSDPFTVLAFADRGERKGWFETMLAFRRAFGDDMRYKLILKARRFSFNFGNPNIEVMTGDLSNEQLRDLYYRAHVMSFPSRGEGFGLPPREFAATGGVSIVTNWSGLRDDVHGYAVPLKWTPETAFPKLFRGEVGQWAKPDANHLATLLRDIADNYEAYSQFAHQAAWFVSTQYRWDEFARRCWQIYEQVTEARYGAVGD